MDDNIEQKVIEVLDAIAVKLGTGVDHFWPLFMRQQLISGIFSMIVGSILIGGAVYSLHRLIKLKEDEVVKIFIGLFPVFIIAGGICLLYDGFSCIFNPEYHALKAVLEMVK